MSRPRAALATPPRRGPRSYGWFLAAAVAEVALYASYQGEDGRFHWFTHFFAGTAFALVAMAVVAKATGRPVRLPFVWLLLGHLVAMAPDFAFVEGVSHGRWMDVFLGHVSSHYVVGRNWTLYVVFLVALGAYLVVIDSLRPPGSRSWRSQRPTVDDEERRARYGTALMAPPPGGA